MTKGRGVDVAIDTSGAPSAQTALVEVTAYRGRAAFVGMQPGTISVPPNRIIERNLTVIGSADPPLGIFDELARFILSHHLPMERLISHTLPLAQATEGFRLADAANTGKVALVWPD